MKSSFALYVCLGLAVLLAACDSGTAVAPVLTDEERVLEAGPVDENSLTVEELSILKDVGLSASKAGSNITRAPVYTIDGLKRVGTSVLTVFVQDAASLRCCPCAPRPSIGRARAAAVHPTRSANERIRTPSASPQPTARQAAK